MDFRNWPYWIRGGIIGIIIYVLIRLMLYVPSKYIQFLLFVHYAVISSLLLNPLGLVDNLFIDSYAFPVIPTFFGEVLIWIFYIILFFIVGAVVGFIVRKIRGGNKK